MQKQRNEEVAEKSEGNVLAGMDFQRRLEEDAYQEGQGKIPVQLFEDFCQNRPSKVRDPLNLEMKGHITGEMSEVFPGFPFGGTGRGNQSL